jgi:hypothetical protein
METWVQIKGVPPKWCDRTTIKEISSSLRKLIEIDWQTLFSSFFSVIRVKVNCKDPKMIPVKRVVEMEDHLYLLHFTVENVEQVEAKPDGDEGKGDGSDGEGDEDEDLLDDEPEKEQETEEEKEKSEGDKSREQGSGKEKEREGEKQTPKTRQKQGRS